VESGEAKDLSTALEAIRQQHPDVYEAHVAEQRQAHRSVVKADVPAPAQAPIHTSVVEFQKRVEALREQGLLHHIAVAKVEASPEGKRLRQRYYNDNPQLGCRS
jgi:hypothetical protein